MIRKKEPSGEHYTWGNNCDGWHLLKSDSLSLIEERMPPQSREILHYHLHAQQVFYMLSGKAVFEINGEEKFAEAGEHVHIPARTLHFIRNEAEEDLRFLVISEPKSHGDRIELIPYAPELKEAVKILNEEWLNKYFRVEPNDTIQLSDPQKEILDKEGMIWYARMNGEIAGTVSLLKVEEGIYELGKMAVTEKTQGYAIGNALMQLCMHIAKGKKMKKLVLYSNTKLDAAIHLYRKYGFTEVILESGHYERANIKMEKLF